MSKSVNPLSGSENSERMVREMGEAAERISELLEPYRSYMSPTNPAVADEGAFAFMTAALSGYLTSKYYGRYSGLYNMLAAGVDGRAGSLVVNEFETLGGRIVAGVLGSPEALTGALEASKAKDPSEILLDHMVAAFGEPEDFVGAWNDYADAIVREAERIAKRLEGIDVENGKEEIAAIVERIVEFDKLLDMRSVYGLDSRYRSTWGGTAIRAQVGELPNILMYVFQVRQYADDAEIFEEILPDAIEGVSKLFQPVSYLRQLYTVTRGLQEGIRIEFPEDPSGEPTPENRIPMFHVANLLLSSVGDPSRKEDPPAIAVGWEGEEFVVANRSADGAALRAFRQGEPGRMRIVRLAEEMGGEVTFVESQDAEMGAMAEIAAMRISMPIIVSATLAAHV
jgi:hypothetical protein